MIKLLTQHHSNKDRKIDPELHLFELYMNHPMWAEIIQTIHEEDIPQGITLKGPGYMKKGYVVKNLLRPIPLDKTRIKRHTFPMIYTLGVEDTVIFAWENACDYFCRKDFFRESFKERKEGLGHYTYGYINGTDSHLGLSTTGGRLSSRMVEGYDMWNELLIEDYHDEAITEQV